MLPWLLADAHLNLQGHTRLIVGSCFPDVLGSLAYHRDLSHKVGDVLVNTTTVAGGSGSGGRLLSLSGCLENDGLRAHESIYDVLTALANSREDGDGVAHEDWVDDVLL